MQRGSGDIKVCAFQTSVPQNNVPGNFNKYSSHLSPASFCCFFYPTKRDYSLIRNFGKHSTLCLFFIE